MGMRATHDLTATVGEYTDREGRTKKRRIKLGVLMQGDNGRISIKLEAFPAGPGWTGWIDAFPKEGVHQPGAGGGQFRSPDPMPETEEQWRAQQGAGWGNQPQRGAAPQQDLAPIQRETADRDYDDDIPFAWVLIPLVGAMATAVEVAGHAI